jgi:hypothetical protein
MKKAFIFVFLVFLCNLLFCQPYLGAPSSIPGSIEAENYDTGGEGVSYHDTTSGNTTGAYRNDDVDIETHTNGYHISYIAQGEWLDYTVTVTAGNYYIDLSTASATSASHGVRIEMDGVEVTEIIATPTNGSWTDFSLTTYGPVTLYGSERTMRIYMSGTDFNIDRLTFRTTSDVPSPSPTPSPTPDPTGTPAPTLGALSVSGKNIVDSGGNVYRIRGIAIPDIDLLVKGGREHPTNFPDMYPKSLEDVLLLTSDWAGVNAIRMTMHANEDDWEIGPVGWDTYANKEDYCANVLDRAINDIANLGYYAIVDWHYFVGRGWTGSDETNCAVFWQKVAPRWANHPNVIYEIFNEPGGGSWGTRSDSNTTDFVDFAERLVNAIRSGTWSQYGLSSTTGAGNLVLVGAPGWSQQLPNAGNPNAALDANLFLTAANVAYVCHVYPQHGQPSWFQYTQKYHPVVLTEFGWELNGTAPTAGTTSGWGQPYKNWVEGFGNVGVVAWCWDPLYRSMMWSIGSASGGIDWELLGSSAQIDPSRIAYGGAPNTYDNYMGQFVRDWYASGAPATPTPDPTPATTQPVAHKGDVNSSGSVDIVDALLIAQYYVGLDPATFDASAADVNCSGVIDIVDALIVAQLYVGLISAFPC